MLKCLNEVAQVYPMLQWIKELGLNVHTPNCKLIRVEMEAKKQDVNS